MSAPKFRMRGTTTASEREATQKKTSTAPKFRMRGAGGGASPSLPTVSSQVAGETAGRKKAGRPTTAGKLGKITSPAREEYHYRQDQQLGKISAESCRRKDEAGYASKYPDARHRAHQRSGGQHYRAGDIHSRGVSWWEYAQRSCTGNNRSISELAGAWFQSPKRRS